MRVVLALQQVHARAVTVYVGIIYQEQPPVQQRQLPVLDREVVFVNVVTIPAMESLAEMEDAGATMAVLFVGIVASIKWMSALLQHHPLPLNHPHPPLLPHLSCRRSRVLVNLGEN